MQQRVNWETVVVALLLCATFFVGWHAYQDHVLVHNVVNYLNSNVPQQQPKVVNVTPSPEPTPSPSASPSHKPEAKK